MSYFSADFMKFMRGLAKNNDREWFKGHKDDFERHVKEPFAEFVGEMIHRIQAVDPAVVLEPKDAIFRIHRDTRFGKDKTPYKTNVSAVITRTGRKDLQYPSIYLQLGAQELGIAGGAHSPDKENLLAIRRAIQADAAGFKRITGAKRFKELCGELQGDKNKILPPEFKGDADRIPWLANKQFYYWASYPGSEALRDDLPEFVMKHYRASQPLNAFLKKAIGLV